MSGVMLKVALYGLIRFTYDLLGDIQWQWGLAVLILGASSALLGVLYALMQRTTSSACSPTTRSRTSASSSSGWGCR